MAEGPPLRAPRPAAGRRGRTPNSLSGLTFSPASWSNTDSMEAVIAVGGKQYRVTPGQVIRVERLPQTERGPVEFRTVLFATGDGQVVIEPKARAHAKGGGGGV